MPEMPPFPLSIAGRVCEISELRPRARIRASSWGTTAAARFLFRLQLPRVFGAALCDLLAPLEAQRYGGWVSLAGQVVPLRKLLRSIAAENRIAQSDIKR